MREVQEAMSSAVEQAVSWRGSVTSPANRAQTTSVAKRQVAKEEGKKGKRAVSNKPGFCGQKSCQAQTSIRISTSTSITLFDARLECYTLNDPQSVLIESETNQLSDSKDKDEPLSSSSGGPGTEQ